MHFGAAMFFTEASMTPTELGPLLEQRGFESVWAPEHSHIPLSRKSPFPGGGDVPKKYYDMFPLESIKLPPYLENDLDDLPPSGIKFAHPQTDHEPMLKSGRWKEA